MRTEPVTITPERGHEPLAIDLSQSYDPLLTFTSSSDCRTIYIKASHIIGVSAHSTYPASEATLLLSNGTSLGICTTHPVEDRALASLIATTLSEPGFLSTFSKDTDFT